MKRLYQTLRSGFTLCVGSLLLALATGLPAMAQKITVNGTIRDAAGNPVVGASIVDLKNPASGTSSGIDGAFSLSADPQAELEISFIGYRSQRIPLNNRTLLEITLEEDTAQIDEVVVVGYGTMRKNDLTGASRRSAASRSATPGGKRRTGHSGQDLRCADRRCRKAR